MANKIMIVTLILIGFVLGDLYASEVILGPDLKIPTHYRPGTGGWGADQEGGILSARRRPVTPQPIPS